MKHILIAVIPCSMIGSCFAQCAKDVDIIVVDDFKKKETLNIEQLANENINSIIINSVVSEERLNLLFYTEKVFRTPKREKRVSLLNNKSLYAGKSPVLNKSDTVNKLSLNIIYVFDNVEIRIRSPGNYI